MDIQRLSKLIYSTACRDYGLDEKVHQRKLIGIKQAIINTIIFKRRGVVSFTKTDAVEVRLQKLCPLAAAENRIYIKIEFGYQNSRIHELHLDEMLSVGELYNLSPP